MIGRLILAGVALAAASLLSAPSADAASDKTQARSNRERFQRGPQPHHIWSHGRQHPRHNRNHRQGG